MLGLFKSRRRRKAERRARVVMASSTALQVLYLYAGQPQHFEKWFGRFVEDEERRELYSHIYERLFAWLSFFAIPAGIVKVVLRENLSDYGLRVGKFWNGLPILALGMPLATAGAWYAAGKEEFRKEYPLSETARKNGADFFLYELSNTQYYVGWEFFYRGFMQHGLEESLGRAGATGFQTAASTLMHIGKPQDETVGAMFGGPMFAWVQGATGSILYPLIIHWWLGFATDFFCLVRSETAQRAEKTKAAVARPVTPLPQRKAAAPSLHGEHHRPATMKARKLHAETPKKPAKNARKKKKS